MSERLRVTGGWPPRKYWEKYPNWTFAFDEEGDDDQDETTMRPADQQTVADLGLSVDCTAGEVIFANGKCYPAMIAEWGVYVEEEHRRWEMKGGHAGYWEPLTNDGTLQERGLVVVPLTDTQVFPMIVLSRLPTRLGRPWKVYVGSDGKVT